MKLKDELRYLKAKLNYYKAIKNFNLEKYYNTKSSDIIRPDIALQIITPKQSLGISGKGVDLHFILLKKICDFIYKDFEITDDNVNFIKYARDLDSIIFRMFDVDGKSKIIEHYPEKINEYQLKEKLKFYQEISDINKNRNDDDKIVRVGVMGDIIINDEFIERIKNNSHITEYVPDVKESIFKNTIK